MDRNQKKKKKKGIELFHEYYWFCRTPMGLPKAVLAWEKVIN